MIVITPSGGRPEALEFLNGYLKRQTFQDFEWIILDDVEPSGKPPSRCDTYIVPDWIWNGTTTQSKSMTRLLKGIKGEKVVICEDDDWYAPNHLELMSNALDEADAVGQVNSIYYNVKTRSHISFVNRGNSGMCQTGVKGEAVDFLRQVCINNPPDLIGLDIVFWRTFKGTKKFIQEQTVVGIKGLAGRNGLGMGHRLNGNNDKSGNYLRSILGNDADNYL